MDSRKSGFTCLPCSGNYSEKGYMRTSDSKFCNQMKWIFLVPLLAALVTPHAQGAEEEVSFSRLETHWGVGFLDAKEVVVRDKTEFEKIWRQLWPHAPELPQIDFNKEAIVVLALGQRPNSGYSIRAERITRAPGSLHVSYMTTSPGAGCITLQVLTAPVDILRFQLPAPSAIFKVRHHVHNCKG